MPSSGRDCHRIRARAAFPEILRQYIPGRDESLIQSHRLLDRRCLDVAWWSHGGEAGVGRVFQGSGCWNRAGEHVWLGLKFNRACVSAFSALSSAGIFIRGFIRIRGNEQTRVCSRNLGGCSLYISMIEFSERNLSARIPSSFCSVPRIFLFALEFPENLCVLGCFDRYRKLS